MTEQWHETGAAAAYVAGDLPPELLDEFEQHMMSCAECRAQIVAGGAATAELRIAPFRRTRRWPATGLGIATLAAAIVVVVLMRPTDQGRLGQIAPPAYIGTAVRASPDSVVAAIDRAMQAYSAKDFRTAARLLAEAARSDSSAAVAFYLGVSLFQTGDTEGALRSFGRAQTPVSNPYAEDATIFAAKALVRLHRPDSAAALVQRAFAAGHSGDALRAFADSLARR
jgi:hypothetical protein